MEKKCSICKIPKDIKEFNKNKARKDGLSTMCKICNRENSKKYYQTKGTSHKQYVVSKNKERKKDVKLYLLHIFLHSSCKDCGTKDHRVFEFDHVRGVKSYDVSVMASRGISLEKVKEEISKCDIVCANCHRIRTYSRMHTYRNVDFNEPAFEFLKKFPELVRS
jgi:hypothetical protein